MSEAIAIYEALLAQQERMLGVLVLAALALVWYGAMLVLLALKVSPHTVNQLSGYRSDYHYLAALKPRTSRPTRG